MRYYSYRFRAFIPPYPKILRPEIKMVTEWKKNDVINNMQKK